MGRRALTGAVCEVNNQLWVGTSAAARLAQARRWLARQDCAGSLLVVATSPTGARDFIHSALADRPAVLGWRYTSLSVCARELATAALAGSGRLPILGAAREAVLARVIARLRASGDLGRYQAVADTPGLARAIAATVDELAMAGVDAAALRAPQADLARLYAGYREELDALGFADRGDVFAAATAVACGRGHALVGLPMLLLDVAITSLREAELVAAMVRTSADWCATVAHGDETTRRWLSEVASLEATEVEAAPPATALDRVQRRLFTAGALEVAPGDDSVVLYSAPGESRECVEVARAILANAADGVGFDRMAVLLHTPAHYRVHLVEALRRAAIPAYFSQGTRRPDPCGRALLALLNCAVDGLSARGFAEYLSLSVVPEVDAEGAPPPAPARGERWVLPEELAGAETGELIDLAAALVGEVDADGTVIAGSLRTPRQWQRLIVDASVIGNLERWRRRLDGLEHTLALARADDDGDGDERAAHLDRKLTALASLRAFAMPLLELLAGLPGEALWGEWIEALSVLASRALRQPQRVLALLAELEPMAPVGPVSLGEVQSLLRSRLTELVVRAGSADAGRVFVGSIDEARGRSFEVVFVPGLAERVFPRKVVEDPILLDDARAEVSADLTCNRDRIARERLALHLAIGASERSLVLSYSRIDGDQARPRVPSFYGLEVLRAGEGRLPGFEELTRRADVAAGARMRWPAPRRAADAIDDTEYDLAILEALIEAPAAERKGAARYLLTANSHLARALRFRARRWGLARWTIADGLVDPEAGAQAALAAHQLSARSYSPTALQAFAACPYSFFLRAILGLEARREPEAVDELDPLQRGSLIHEVQFTLLRLLRDAGLLPVRAANLDDAIRRLDEVIAEVATRYYDELAPAIDKVWEDGIIAIRRDLREWLSIAAREPFTPHYFELGFGLRGREGRDAASTIEPVELACGISVRGSIDLVEGEGGRLRATDHKTGRAPRLDGFVIGGGRILQPVVYGLALAELFRDREVVAGRLYYCTDRGGFHAYEVAIDERAQAAMKLVAEAVGEALTQGFFPAAPQDGACTYCDYQAVCGPYEELRTRRKDKRRIAKLTELRRHP